MINFNQKGFTIVELLIVIVIMGVLTLVVMVNFQSGRRSQELRQAGTELQQNIRLAQSYTIGGNSIKYCSVGSNQNPQQPCSDDTNCGSGTCKLGVPLGGYGISVNSTQSYKLFADTTDNQFYEGSIIDYLIIDKFLIKNDISIAEFKFDDEGVIIPGNNRQLDITFFPPVGTVNFYYDEGEARDSINNQLFTNVQILIKSDYVKNYCRTILINRISGQVSESKSDCNL